MKSALLTVLILATSTVRIELARADDKKTDSKEAYLGLRVESVPSVLHSQMPGILPKGQGVVVDRIAQDSPAGKAGLQPNDILVSYDDQKLYSPEQLMRLVRADKPTHEVTLGYVRAGKSMTCKVTLGATRESTTPEKSHIFRFFPDEKLVKLVDEFQSKNGESVWDTFDAIKLSRVDDKRWHAEVEYRSQEGKKVSKVYEGTRDEIRKAIQAEKDLPANERTQLLHALNLHDPVFEFHFLPGESTSSGFSDHF